MAEQEEISDPRTETFTDKNSEKFHGGDGDSSSSSSDSDSESKKTTTESSVKEKVYRLFGREKPVHKVFGGGKPADIFLWRNKKISASVLGTATAIWVLFELLEYHLLTLICHIAILALSLSFLWSNASIFINKRPPHIPEVRLPEGPFLEVASALRSEINRGFYVLREIASGRDLKKFLGVVAGLWFLSIVGSCCSFLTLFYMRKKSCLLISQNKYITMSSYTSFKIILHKFKKFNIYIVFVLLHTVPVLYEKYDDKIDAYAEKAVHEIKKQYAVFDHKVLSKIPKGPLSKKRA